MHISRIPNVDHLPATSSPFRKYTVSSSLQPSAFSSSSSVQITAVTDNRRLTLSKTFQDFGFLCDVNQTVTSSVHCVCQISKGGNNEQKLQK